jgi:FlaA1/EpsC-like NDP-sugar epimerase
MSDLVRLLGRDPITVDPVGSYLTGRRVLVTGAGGSIGGELCRQVARHRPAELVMLGRGESTLLASAATLPVTTPKPRVVLADVRDRTRIGQVVAHHQPQVVFHAAALKHQPILEAAPAEAVKTNVWGTGNVLHAADQAGVRVLVNISTDKACDPSCVLGASKRLAERMTAWHAQRLGRNWMSVRFGNVLGSRGSVLGVFARQLADGGPLTITSPDVDRYFMTATEAAQLVIAAGAIGSPGEALVLDMGAPVRIADLAARMAKLMGADPPIVYTGLRPGEKLHETLIGADEHPHRPHHPLIDHVTVPPLNPANTAGIDTDLDCGRLRALLADLCRTGRPIGAGSVR